MHSIWITASPVLADKWPEAGYVILEKSRKHQAIPLMQALPVLIPSFPPFGTTRWARSLFPGTEDLQMAFLHNFMHESTPSVTDSVAAERRTKETGYFYSRLSITYPKGQLLLSNAHI